MPEHVRPAVEEHWEVHIQLIGNGLEESKRLLAMEKPDVTNKPDDRR